MSPKNKDHDSDFDAPDDDRAPIHDEIIDAEDFSEEEPIRPGGDEPLRAPRAEGESEEDYADFDDAAEEERDRKAAARKRNRSGGGKGLIVTGIIFAGAASAGVYLGLNPGIMAGLTGKGMPPAATLTASVTPETPPQPVPVESPFATLPQPVPPGGETAPPPMPLAEMPVETPVPPVVPPPELAAVSEPVPAPAPETPASEIPVTDPSAAPAEAQAEMPVAQMQEQESAQTMPETAAAAEIAQPVPPPMPDPAAGTPAPEAVPSPEAAPATPPVTPEETAMLPVPAPEATPAPEQPPAPAAAEEPGFVPAEPPSADMPPPVVEASDSVLPPTMPPADAPATGAPVAEPPPSLADINAPAVPATDVTLATPPAESGQASAPARAESPLGDSDVYYDSALNVPTGTLATSVGPREVNPVVEPASKMVIVRRDAGPDTFEATLVSAGRALKLGRYEAALEMYNQLYKKSPRDERVLMGRAVAQQHSGLTESAIRSYEELLAVSPKNREATVNMMGLVSQQYPEVALRRLIDLYRDNPQNAGIAAQVGITSAKVGQYDEAMRYLGIAASIEPTKAEHIFNMAIATDRRGNKAEAVRLYEKALELDAVYGESRSVPRSVIYDRLSVLRRG